MEHKHTINMQYSFIIKEHILCIKCISPWPHNMQFPNFYPSYYLRTHLGLIEVEIVLLLLLHLPLAQTSISISKKFVAHHHTHSALTTQLQTRFSPSKQNL